MNRLTNSGVGATTANIGDIAIDVLVTGLRVAFQEVDGCHDLTGLTIAALRYVMLKPCLLHGMQLIV